MPQILSGDAHGLFRVQIGFVNENGYNYGQVNPSGTVADGTTMPAYLMKYPKSAEMALPDRTVLDFTGGDVWTGSFVYGITSLGSFSLTLSNVDTTMIAMTSDSVTDQTTNTRWTIYSENIMLPTPPQVFMLTTFRIQSKDPGTKGAAKFIHMVLPRVWVAPKGLTGAPVFQGPGEYNYNVIPTVGDKMPHGIAFSQSGQHWSENETPSYFMITDNPVFMVGHIASAGSNAVINLPYKPVGAASVYTTPDSSTQPVQVVVDGIVTDATTVNPTTGAVTVPGPFDGGEYIGILYETIFDVP